MFFSIVIPLYNKVKYIEKALTSVVNQTFVDWELIVVDDGSKDDSYEVTEYFLKTQARGLWHIIRQDNAGVGTARNNGVAAASGDYVCFLDADDWWDERFLEEMHGLIMTYPDAGIYGTAFSQVKGGVIKQAPIGVDKDFEHGYIDYVETYSRTMCMPLSSISVAISCDVFREMGGFCPELKIGEDFILWLQVALRYKVAFLNKPLTFYNHDVDAVDRAVGKLYQPEQTEYFCYQKIEKTYSDNKSLKCLLDKKRLYVLPKYLVSKKYRSWARLELDNVDWTAYSKMTYLKHHAPAFVWKLWFMLVGLGVKMKKSLRGSRS